MAFDKKWLKEYFVEPFVRTILESPSVNRDKALQLIESARRNRISIVECQGQNSHQREKVFNSLKGLAQTYAGDMGFDRLFGHQCPSKEELYNIVDKIVLDLVREYYEQEIVSEIKTLFKQYAIRNYDRSKIFSFMVDGEKIRKLIKTLGIQQVTPDQSIYKNHYTRGNFSAIDLSDMSFNKACFNGCFLPYADLSNSTYIADGTTATCMHANLDHANLENFQFVNDFNKGCCIKTSSFVNANLRGANLTGVCNWTGCTFIGADLRGAYIKKGDEILSGERLRKYMIDVMCPAAVLDTLFVDADLGNTISVDLKVINDVKNSAYESNSAIMGLLKSPRVNCQTFRDEVNCKKLRFQSNR